MYIQIRISILANFLMCECMYEFLYVVRRIRVVIYRLMGLLYQCDNCMICIWYEPTYHKL